MPQGVPNIAKGAIAHYSRLTGAGDQIVAVLLSAAEADDALNNYDDLAALLGAAGNTEATFTGYSQQDLVNVVVTIDDTANTVSIDADDPQWSPTTAEALVKIVFCYDPDGTNTAANMVPIFFDDFGVTTPTSGTVRYQVATGGYCVCS